VARAPADGHTLFLTTNTTHSANPALMRRLDYDPQRDFTPIARLGTPIFLLVVGPTVAARDVAGFIAWARGRDGQLNYASANAIGVVGMATLARLAGFNATNVPYRSAPQALTDLIGGRVDAMMIDITASMAMCATVDCTHWQSPRAIARGRGHRLRRLGLDGRLRSGRAPR